MVPYLLTVSDLEGQADTQSQDGDNAAHTPQNTMMMKMLLEMKNKLDSMGADDHELSEEEHSDDPGEIIDEDEEKEEEPVSQVLADYVTSKYMTEVPPEQIKRKMERYERPRNVPALQTKKVRNCSDSNVGILAMH